MIKGTTKAGFAFEFDETKLNDMRFVESLAEADNGSMLALTGILNKMLGEEQKERMYKHYESEDGRVPIEAIQDAVSEMFETTGDEVKN
jgi:hypothetical protein